MMRITLNLALAAALLPLPAGVFAQGADPVSGAPPEPAGRTHTGLLLPDTLLIDVPTAGVADHSGFSSRTRFFSNGGVVEFLNFGVYPRVNLGVSANVDGLIGSRPPVRITRPELQFKIRAFDGDRIIPALAVGFDSQGYLHNRGDKRYNQRQHGLYFIGSQEIGLPGLMAHAGMYVSDFDSNDLGGILAANYNVQDRVMPMIEWDNINNFLDSRLNIGMRFYLIPNFHFDFALRGIGMGGKYTDGTVRGPERIVQFKYTGSF
ncbi:MAG: hypothetical protein ABIJ96_05555 [Elusimicrobiota bacterium]